MDQSPFGRSEGDLIDFRGYPAHKILVKDVTIKDIDLSYADFSSSWLEANRFENCLFVRTNFTDASDHGDIFDHCKFLYCKFKLAVLGYNGTRFRNCVFKECGFQKTNFIRPEFVNTDFINCRLKGIDFSGSSFEDCKFEGLLEDVWFRGTFAYQSYFKEFGRPKINRMENVSFENADLIDLTVSDGCDLSTVRLKKNGKYFKYDNWLKRLKVLEREIETWGTGEQKREAEKYVKVSMVHAQKQEWKILNLEDLERHYGGRTTARRIVDVLNEYAQ
jgi:fluoroquinolone resistance protein